MREADKERDRRVARDTNIAIWQVVKALIAIFIIIPVALGIWAIALLALALR